ncbi:MAG: bifunctional 4-hydroxy-2-oxoglutarate aldolase/2-dehydro-3-deoxy-phosphogluconate aldolase [Chryseolinea sp.]
MTMNFTNQQIVDQMKSTGVVPLFTHDNPDEALAVLKAVYDGGIRAFEFTNRRKNSYEVFVQLLEASKSLPGLMMGIGTVMDAVTTKRFIEAGAHFIISPIMKVEMAEVCRLYDRLWMPGCATLTEIVTAREHGAHVIKVFPGSVLGPGFVSAIMPVVPDIQLMITGGVEPNEKSLSAWFNAGAACVGLGSQLFTKDIMESRDWPALTNKVKDLLELAKRVRNQS